MIEDITKEQQELIEEYREKYLQIGTSTDRIEKPVVDEIVNNFYRTVLGKTPPENIYLHDGPNAAWEHIKELEELDPNEKFVWPYIDGSFFANTIGYYSYMLEVLKVPIEEKLRVKFEAWHKTLQVGLVYPREHYCVVTQKPTSIVWEGEDLHNLEGPAIAYADGTKIYMIRGIRVDGKYIDGEWTGADVLKEPNAEVRMTLIRHLDLSKILGSIRHKVVDTAKSTRHPSAVNRLLELEIEGEKVRALELHWKDLHSEKTTFIWSWRTKEEFKEHTEKDFRSSIPEDPNSCEQVRLWSMGVPQEAAGQLGVET